MIRLRGKFLEKLDRSFYEDGKSNTEIELPEVNTKDLKEGDMVLLKVKIKEFVDKETIGLFQIDGGMYAGIEEIVAILPPKAESK